MATRLITVSQLKCACLDVDWRRRWLRGETPPTQRWSIGPAKTDVPVQGILFHQLAEHFTQWLAEGTARKTAAALANPEALWGHCYERFAKPKLDELLAAGKVLSAHHLSKALRAFCDRLADLRARFPGFQTWQDIYLTREFNMSGVRLAGDGRAVLVSGRPDAVRMHPEDGVEVVDYKLSRGANLKHDLLQVAIYARLLREVKPGLKFSGMLEYYEPALHVVPVAVSELDGIFEEIIAPVLAELAAGLDDAAAGVSPAVAAGVWPAGGALDSRQGVVPAGDTPAATSDPIAAAIVKCYADFKLNVHLLGSQGAPQLVRYRVQPASGVRVVSLANRAEDLQVALRLRQPPLIQAAPGCVTIDIPKDQPDTVFWRDLPRGGAPLAFPIGVGIDSELLTADFADPNTCHALIAGTSGSGKSEFLKCLAASLIERNPPRTLRLSLIDPKILTFGALSGCAHLLEPVITDLPAAIACLEMAVEEMEVRYRRLSAAGVENLAQLGASEQMPYRVIIFDEFGDLVLGGKRDRERFENLVARIAQKGRAAGIHLVLATQRPDARIVTGLIKANLPLKICCRVVNGLNSQMILDQPGAEALLGRGDLLCNRGRGIERAQSAFISQEELAGLCGMTNGE